MESGHPLPPAPLPLIRTNTEVPAAHGRAPGWPKGAPPKPSEVGSVGRGGAWERTEFSPSGGNGVERTLRRRGSRRVPWAWRSSTAANGAAAGIRGRVCRLTPTPEIGRCTTLSCALVKTGVRGCRRLGHGPPFGPCHSAPDPRRIFGFFLCEQKETRRQAKPDRFFWRIQKKWFLVSRSQRRSLWFCLLFARAKRRSPQGETLQELEARLGLMGSQGPRP